MTDDPEKPDSKDEKGVFEKYEMIKLNKYAIVVTIVIANLAAWVMIYKINYSWDLFLNPNLILLGSIKLGIIIALFSAFFLYFNKKINFLLDERNKKL